MDWKRLLEREIRDFILRHEAQDSAALALKRPPVDGWPYGLILDQIKSRQKAANKVPSWLAIEGIVFPPPDIMEQASSAATARYKAKLINGKAFADLTGGAGVDSWAFAQHFPEGHIVEQDETAAALLAHNMPRFSQCTVYIHHARAEDFVRDMPVVDLVYIDPQRRSKTRKGLYRLEDGAPDIISLLPFIRTKARYCMVKTSPMLDIRQTLLSLPDTAQIHIVEWRGECREVLYLLDFSVQRDPDDVLITAVAIDDEGREISALRFTHKEEQAFRAVLGLPLRYLYEPDPGFQKCGAFNLMAGRYGLEKLHTNTHLYTSDDLRADFPGRIFEILGILPVNRKSLPFDQANLSMRNFPGDVAGLRKKLKLKDGGEEYLFACTLLDERKVLIYGRKAM